PPMGAAMLGQQTANQRRRALRVGKQTAFQTIEHRRPAHDRAPPRPPATALADRAHVVHARADAARQYGPGDAMPVLPVSPVAGCGGTAEPAQHAMDGEKDSVT